MKNDSLIYFSISIYSLCNTKNKKNCAKYVYCKYLLQINDDHK